MFVQRAGSNPPMPAPGAGFHHAGYNDWAASGVGYEVHEPSTTDVAELERRLTETRLKEQQRQMREDNQWLAQVESSQVKRYQARYFLVHAIYTRK
jgi:hypothetical protein